jgi:hypothetical protein
MTKPKKNKKRQHIKKQEVPGSTKRRRVAKTWDARRSERILRPRKEMKSKASSTTAPQATTPSSFAPRFKFDGTQTAASQDTALQIIMLQQDTIAKQQDTITFLWQTLGFAAALQATFGDQGSNNIKHYQVGQVFL